MSKINKQTVIMIYGLLKPLDVTLIHVRMEPVNIMQMELLIDVSVIQVGMDHLAMKV